MQNNTENKVVSRRGRKPVIQYKDIRWDRMTDREVAEKVYNDPENAGKIKAKSFQNFKVTVFLKRKALIKAGRNAAFQGRTVTAKDGTKVKKTKWVRSKIAVTANQ